MASSSSAERYRLRDAFHAVRVRVLERVPAPALSRSVAYWALSADRRLPIALLDRSLCEILDTPFERLAATPGIGLKKIAMLLTLLRRAAEHAGAIDGFGEDGGPQVDSRQVIGGACAPVAVRAGVRAGVVAADTGASAANQGGSPPPPLEPPGADVDPDLVSETLWSRWRTTVRRNELEHECLGRFAPSLHGVPTVIWQAPLGDYTPLSLAELRRRKTHGEKRVRVILQVFRGLHEVLGDSAAPGRLALRPLPRFIVPVESWIRMATRAATPLGWAEVRVGLALPLINQVALDAGPQISKLVESRLGVEGVAETVVEQARRLGLTRARVYQMLETCAAIMAVRWPEGRLQFDALSVNSRRAFLDPESRRLFEACQGLCFPREHQPRSVDRRSGRRAMSTRRAVDQAAAAALETLPELAPPNAGAVAIGSEATR